MDYLSELSIGEADQIVYRRLRALSYDSEVDLLKGETQIDDFHISTMFI